EVDDELWQALDQVGIEVLIPECQQHLLLAGSAARITILMASAGKDEGLFTVQVLPPCGEVDSLEVEILRRITGVMDRVGVIDVDPADRIYHFNEAIEIDLNKGVDGNTEICLDRADHQARTAALDLVVITEGEGCIDLVDTVPG